MKKELENLLAILKEEYINRKELIQDNIKDINNIPTDKETIDAKMELDELNQDLRKLNESNMELQNSIKNYIQIHLSILDSDSDLSYEKCLALTIAGAIKYNELNPYFYDESFYNDLLEYYIKKEDYTKCELIKNSRFNLSN